MALPNGELLVWSFVSQRQALSVHCGRLPTWSAPTTCRRSAIAIRFGLQLFHVKRRVKGGVMWRRLFRAGVTRKVPPHHSPAVPTPTTLPPAKHPPRRNSSRATEDPRRNQNFSPVCRGPACAPGASTIPARSLRRAHFLTAQLEGDHVSRETRRMPIPHYTRIPPVPAAETGTTSHQ